MHFDSKKNNIFYWFSGVPNLRDVLQIIKNICASHIKSIDGPNVTCSPDVTCKAHYKGPKRFIHFQPRIFLDTCYEIKAQDQIRRQKSKTLFFTVFINRSLSIEYTYLLSTVSFPRQLRISSFSNSNSTKSSLVIACLGDFGTCSGSKS